MDTLNDGEVDCNKRSVPPKVEAMSVDEYLDRAPRSATLTKWTNPTAEPVKLSLYVAPKRYLSVSIEPGGSVAIPAEFDGAIHALDKVTGLVVGGLAPQLRRENQSYGLHECLIPGAARSKELRRWRRA